MLNRKDGPLEPGELAVVVGSGASGLAAARLLHFLGARVRIVDRNPASFTPVLKEKALYCHFELLGGEHKPEHFSGAKLVVPSPGVPLKTLEPMLAEAGGPLCISELELASRFISESIIAVTGTSGKTTTVSLIAAMLREVGLRVFLGGNIGTPLSEYVLDRESLGQRAEVLVLEVSSFQLQGCRAFRPQVAVFLNLSENHLDQHRSMEEYVEAKFSLFRNQGVNDVAILGEELFSLAQERRFRARVEYFAASGRFLKTRLLGRHNRANLEAAFMAASRYGVTAAQAAKVAEEFAPLPHRLEMCGEYDGVLYVNDSKGTTVEALRVALESVERPVWLLAGGVFKGGDLGALRGLLREKVKAVGLFGASREIFEEAWQGVTFISWDETMEEAMRRMRAQAEPGDVILLAPATSSFDLYSDYKERGNDFKRLADLIK